MKRRKRICWMLLICFVLGTFSGCALENETTVQVENDVNGTLDENGLLVTDGSLPIKDNSAWYDGWDSNEVVTMYLTVREGNRDDGTNHTWEEVNTHSADFYNRQGIDRYKVEALLQVGDENGPVVGELGYGQITPNATVQVRGQSSSSGAQKSFKISLRDGKGDWEGLTTINLNKHMFDMYRFTNMLSYNLMQKTDAMMSARTKFVHLYVKDETRSGTSEQFVDYGLYTFVEQINKSYLKNHGLDRNGQLYKINFFEFFRYDDVIMLKSDADYDAKKFEEYLEIKGNDDHSKLIAMLEDLNNYSISIEDVMSKWFDEENYFNWLAFQILMGNKDTQSRNHFLYSPSNVNKFYFISWDNDASLRTDYNTYREYQDGMGFEEGVSNYWGNILHKRVLQSETYREKLDRTIIKLKEEVLTEANVTTLANQYAKTVEPYLYSLPDINFAPTSLPYFKTSVANIYGQIENNHATYLENLKKPMPFYLGDPKEEDGLLEFDWDSSYDFNLETVTYKIEVSDGYGFTNIIYSKEGILVPEISFDMLPAGQYFYRVTATNGSGYSQMAFDYYHSERGKEYGIKCFWITKDGQIRVDTYEQE